MPPEPEPTTDESTTPPASPPASEPSENPPTPPQSAAQSVKLDASELIDAIAAIPERTAQFIKEATDKTTRTASHQAKQTEKVVENGAGKETIAKPSSRGWLADFLFGKGK